MDKDELIRYYEEEIQRLKLKLAVRDRLLFNKQYENGEFYESRTGERETFDPYPEED